MTIRGYPQWSLQFSGGAFGVDRPRTRPDLSGSWWAAGPFVCWPEHHVYSLIHGDRLGIGTYYRPENVGQHELEAGTGITWPESSTPVIESAQRLLRPEARFTPRHRVNGVFAMTPDNLSFLGPEAKCDCANSHERAPSGSNGGDQPSTIRGEIVDFHAAVQLVPCREAHDCGNDEDCREADVVG